MEVNSLEQLAKVSKSLTEEELTRSMTKYGNLREERGYEHGWNECMKMNKKIRMNRRKMYKDTLIDYDEENRCISLEEFIKFFASVEDELKYSMNFGTDELRGYAVNLHDFMCNKLGKIKTDRRLIFGKE